MTGESFCARIMWNNVAKALVSAAKGRGFELTRDQSREFRISAYILLKEHVYRIILNAIITVIRYIGEVILPLFKSITD